jgi:2'-5' RNA ligase
VREVKWVAPENLHVTLLFLGDTPEEKVPVLQEALAAVSVSATPFEAAVGGWSGFPNSRRPEVFFSPLTQGGEAVARLAGAVSGSLRKAGFAGDEKKFHAHLTLGRMRRGQDEREAVQFLQRESFVLSGAWRVDRFLLFQSRLSPEGAHYSVLGEFLLAG